MGVAPETVSRWETGALAMGGTAERLLRLMVRTRKPLDDSSLDLLKDVAKEKHEPLRLGMRSDPRGWHSDAA